VIVTVTHSTFTHSLFPCHFISTEQKKLTLSKMKNAIAVSFEPFVSVYMIHGDFVNLNCAISCYYSQGNASSW
jgi:hypothetical protein